MGHARRRRRPQQRATQRQLPSPLIGAETTLALLAEVTHDVLALQLEQRYAVAQARADGATWADIARALGVSRQAAAKRFPDADEGPTQAQRMAVMAELRRMGG